MSNASRSRQPVSRSAKQIGVVIASAVVLCTAWTAYTGYSDDDAYITFRYARQIAQGNGFVYNVGERVYGTTTPLLALMLSAWIRFSDLDVALGAHLIDIVAFSLTLVVLWSGLKQLNATHSQQVAVLLLIGFSPRLWYLDMQGMETPVVLVLMASSWWGVARDRPGLAGVLAGFLLWTRIDTLVWLAALIFSAAVARRKNLARFAVSAALVYLPWLAFAWAYFGSPVPHTAVAKWVAYGINSPPLQVHLAKIAGFLSPMDLPASVEGIAAGLAFITIALASWAALFGTRRRAVLVFSLFILLDVTTLTVTRTTYFDRYFVPLLAATLVLAGLTLGGIWDAVARGSRPRRIAMFILTAGLGVSFIVLTLERATEIRDKQLYRYESSLKAIGLWLRSNSPPGSTVLLEPLGYIGFYSERRIIDEVGLVTPRVVELKRQGVTGPQYASRFQPDYVLFHCDDNVYLEALPQTAGLAQSLAYSRLVIFNPLGFRESSLPPVDREAKLARNACYQLFGRNEP